MNKKRYVRPDVYCESFVLSQHIASCGLKMHQANEDECTGEITDNTIEKDPAYEGSLGLTLFTSGISCDVDNEEYCYTNSTNDLGMLHSS